MIKLSGFKRLDLTWNVRLGTCLPRVQSCVASPHVAKVSPWPATWLRPVTMCLVTTVSRGTSDHSPSPAPHTLIVLSSPTVIISVPAAKHSELKFKKQGVTCSSYPRV